MLLRVAIVAIAFAGCGPNTNVEPDAGDAPTGDSFVLMPDASPCAAVDIAAGGDHTCAITATGELYCWGRDDDGQIGVEGVSNLCAQTVYCQKTPAKVQNLPRVIGVGGGGLYTCAATVDQTYCWGRNMSAEYGNGTTVGVAEPLAIAQRANATAVDGGNAHTCSLAGMNLSCSGANGEGQVGNSSIGQQGIAVQVMTGVASFNLGGTTSCAVTSSQQLYCWGRNVYRTIDTSGTIKTVPARVDGIANVRQVAVGADHLCAVVAGNQALCWGLNTSGQIGNGQTNGTQQPQPMTVVSTNAAEVAASRNHTCVRTTTGDVYCFGEGYTPVPTKIVGGATKITAGNGHDCAVIDDGTIRCWGDQTYGQLGNNVNLASRTNTPQLARVCP
jgi:alpha-tubulin suppressor-like RCC1 family protein